MIKSFEPSLTDCPICDVYVKEYKYTTSYINNITRKPNKLKRWKRYCDKILVDNRHHYEYNCDGHITIEYPTHTICNWIIDSPINHSKIPSGAIFGPWDKKSEQLETIYRSNNGYIPICDNLQELIDYLHNKEILS